VSIAMCLCVLAETSWTRYRTRNSVLAPEVTGARSFPDDAKVFSYLSQRVESAVAN